MTTATAPQVLPNKLFPAIFAGLAAVVVVIGAMRLSGMAPVGHVDTGVAEEVLQLHVEDGKNGDVHVFNAHSGVLLHTYRRAEGSFFRATLRALVNDRRRKGARNEGDFVLERHAGGQLYLIDGVTGKRLTLNAYGPDNSAAFAALMSNQKGEGQ
jgi:putative photosynthetic complex assembly protein